MISIERASRIAELAKVSIGTVLEWVHYDWGDEEEHLQWLENASDEEVANWIRGLEEEKK